MTKKLLFLIPKPELLVVSPEYQMCGTFKKLEKAVFVKWKFTWQKIFLQLSLGRRRLRYIIGIEEKYFVFNYFTKLPPNLWFFRKSVKEISEQAFAKKKLFSWKLSKAFSPLAKIFVCRENSRACWKCHEMALFPRRRRFHLGFVFFSNTNFHKLSLGADRIIHYMWLSHRPYSIDLTSLFVDCLLIALNVFRRYSPISRRNIMKILFGMAFVVSSRLLNSGGRKRKKNTSIRKGEKYLKFQWKLQQLCKWGRQRRSRRGLF